MEALLTTMKAAEYLGYSSFTLRASRSRGKLSGRTPPTHIKLGNKTIRYRRKDLDRWIKMVSVSSEV